MFHRRLPSRHRQGDLYQDFGVTTPKGQRTCDCGANGQDEERCVR